MLVLLLQSCGPCNNRRLTGPALALIAGLALALIAGPVLPFPTDPVLALIAGLVLLRCAAGFHFLSFAYSPSRQKDF